VTEQVAAAQLATAAFVSLSVTWFAVNNPVIVLGVQLSDATLSPMNPTTHELEVPEAKATPR
jgi:hypothetical protein